MIKQKVASTVYVFPFITLVHLCSCMLYSILCHSSEELILKNHVCAILARIEFWVHNTWGGGGGKHMYKKTALT
jgi:hypothetical protein